MNTLTRIREEEVPVSPIVSPVDSCGIVYTDSDNYQVLTHNTLAAKLTEQQLVGVDIRELFLPFKLGPLDEPVQLLLTSNSSQMYSVWVEKRSTGVLQWLFEQLDLFVKDISQPQLGSQVLEIDGITYPVLANGQKASLLSPLQGMIIVESQTLKVTACSPILTKNVFGLSQKPTHINDVIKDWQSIISDVSSTASSPVSQIKSPRILTLMQNIKVQPCQVQHSSGKVITSTHIAVRVLKHTYVLWLTSKYSLSVEPIDVKSLSQVQISNVAIKSAVIDEREPTMQNMQELAKPQQQSPSGLQQHSPSKKSHKLQDYKVVKKLGEGSFGLVMLTNLEGVGMFVIKKVQISKVRKDAWTSENGVQLPLEISILKHITKTPHKNLVQMHQLIEDKDFYYIIMNHLGSMDLFDYIDKNLDLSEAEIKGIFRQVANGVEHLHNMNIIHRDIKDENCVIDVHSKQIQLIDFGSACHYKEHELLSTFTGTIDYISPEVLCGCKYSGPPQDVWACGILMYILSYKENPFYNLDEVVKRDLQVPQKLPNGDNQKISGDFQDLLERILCKNVNLRATITQVVEHPWFATSK